MTLQLVSFALCPFVQRAVIALTEKQVDFSIEYVDLENPPEWFNQASPLGKVPILRVDGEVIFESSVILDYLDETQMPRLHPASPLKRAQHKAWIEYGSGLLMDQLAICKARDEGEYQRKTEILRHKLQRLVDPLAAGQFTGDTDFTLLDAAYAPLFMRMAILAGMHEKQSHLLPKGVESWSERLLDRPSVVSSVVEDFSARFIDYFTARQSWLMSHFKELRQGI